MQEYPIEIFNNVWINISADHNHYWRLVKMKYRVHRLKLRMTEDQHKLEEFLNSLEGEIVSIIPNVCHIGFVHVDFLLIVEKIA